jgi:RimJ/RimL family protein N-acetyltransferase
MIDFDKVFSKFPNLETDSLKLQQFSEFDVMAYYKMCQDPDYVREFIPEGMQVSQMDAINTITKKYPQGFRDRQDLTWAVILKGPMERIIGLRDLFIDSPYEPVVTQGFISKEHRNRGYNQEVLLAVKEFLKSVGADNLLFNCSADNQPVLHIANKLQFDDITPFQMSMISTRKKFQLTL